MNVNFDIDIIGKSMGMETYPPTIFLLVDNFCVRKKIQREREREKLRKKIIAT